MNAKHILAAGAAGLLAYWALGRRRTISEILRAECLSVPAAYAWALAKHESDLDPANVTKSAVGLLQVTPDVLDDYNAAEGTSYTRQDLFDPQINARIACDLLGRISKLLPLRHPYVLPRRGDWTDRRVVEIFTLAWNAGWSESHGVGYVLGVLERRGEGAGVTVRSIQAAAKGLPNAAEKLTWDKAIRYAERVAGTYLARVG